MQIKDILKECTELADKLAKDDVKKRVAVKDLSSSMGLYLKRKFWQHKFAELEA
jgi:hypothetical protein